ncbi:MAG TPA: hypothetical protein DF383_11790, partial [Deltaproteobacteria bacterium]|nr:hypothetical protein [Deltaproteobacteria bacterium]
VTFDLCRALTITRKIKTMGSYDKQELTEKAKDPNSGEVIKRYFAHVKNSPWYNQKLADKNLKFINQSCSTTPQKP